MKVASEKKQINIYNKSKYSQLLLLLINIIVKQALMPNSYLIILFIINQKKEIKSKSVNLYHIFYNFIHHKEYDYILISINI